MKKSICVSLLALLRLGHSLIPSIGNPLVVFVADISQGAWKNCGPVVVMAQADHNLSLIEYELVQLPSGSGPGPTEEAGHQS